METQKKIAYCGLDCMACGAFIATKNNDNTLREKTAREWSKLFKVTIPSSDIDCMGCQSGKLQFGHCKTCKIRKCAREKDVENCAACNEYPCCTLEDFLAMAPEAGEALEQLRK